MSPETLEKALDALVDEYRTRCLWFLREDYYPKTTEERLKVLGYVERHGDMAGYRRAAELKRWLLQNSNAASVG